jgi:dTMP kinase
VVAAARHTAGVLIALEGIDGSGKTTQAMSLAATLARIGRRVLCTQEPTFGPGGRRLRDYLAGADRHLTPSEELELFQADRREHVANTIRPALARGWIVITDRYYYSSAAYQGALGLDPQTILAASEAFAPRPNLVVIFTLPLPVALARRQEAHIGQVQVTEEPSYLEKVAALYDQFQGPHIRRLDATAPTSNVLGRLLNLTMDALAAARTNTSGA